MVKIELLDGKVSAKTREGPPGDDKGIRSNPGIYHTDILIHS